MIELRVLGSVEIRDDDSLSRPTRRMARTLLGMLALRANQPVSMSWIVDGLWNGRPPRSANSNIRSLLADLRGLLPATTDTEPRIEGGKGRYRLVVPRDRLDSLTFEALADEGATALAAGRYSSAVAGLVRATTLWRGPILDGLAVPDVVRPEASRLTERRLDVLEDSVDARIALGQHRDLVAELTALTARHGPRERLWRQLMVVLYRCDRQADALAAYQRLYQLLDEELGATPGQHTRQVHERILAADTDLLAPAALDTLPDAVAVSRPSTAPAVPPASVPRQLPPRPAEFVGRVVALAALDQATAASLVVVTGTAGIGKTAFALHWAHRSVDRFPDGCLYVDLRGFGPDAQRQPAEVLATLLRGLRPDPTALPETSPSAPAATLPTDLAELTACYRTALAERRMLIVLDNARSAEQVRPLLPGSPSSRVLVTSRDDLAGLVARDGARRIELEPLPADEAFSLLHKLIGERVTREPTAAFALAEHCVRLPLALRIAAELAASRDTPSLAELVDELAARAHRLDLLDAGGDPHTAVRAVFDWSYQALADEPARAFRLLGTHPGPDLDRYTAAALLDRTPIAAQLLIDTLRRAHLLRPLTAGRYTMHDLLRAYACELAEQEQSARPALSRLFDHYLRTAGVAMAVCYPAERDLRPRLPAPATASQLTTPALGRAWLERELPGILALAVARAEPDWAARCVQLARTIWRHLDRSGRHIPALALYKHALTCARQLGDAAGEGAMCHYLGMVHARSGDYPTAVAHARRALKIQRAADDRAAEGRTLNTLAYCAHQQGRFAEAIGRYSDALRCARGTADAVGAAAALGNLSLICWQLGRRGEAVDYQQQQLLLTRTAGDRPGEATALGSLGAFHVRLGHYAEALTCQQQELAIARELADRAVEADALAAIGFVLQRLDRNAEALVCLAEALVINEETGNKAGTVFVLNTSGEALQALGRETEAALRHTSALRLAREIDDRPEQARALDALADRLRTRDPGRAKVLWQQALAIYRELAVPDAVDLDESAPAMISIRLAELDNSHNSHN